MEFPVSFPMSFPLDTDLDSEDQDRVDFYQDHDDWEEESIHEDRGDEFDLTEDQWAIFLNPHEK